MHADQIAVINGGLISELGTHDTLVKEGGIYAKLVSRQMKRDENVINEANLDVGATGSSGSSRRPVERLQKAKARARRVVVLGLAPQAVKPKSMNSSTASKITAMVTRSKCRNAVRGKLDTKLLRLTTY